MIETFKQLAAVLANDGIQCQFQSPGQFVISRQEGAVWPNRGNSFWVTRVEGTWHLFTWSPVGYRVPKTSDVASLCRECMQQTTTAMYEMPSEIIQVFAVRELSDDEADVVYEKMKELGE